MELSLIEQTELRRSYTEQIVALDVDFRNIVGEITDKDLSYGREEQAVFTSNIEEEFNNALVFAETKSELDDVLRENIVERVQQNNKQILTLLK